MVMPLLARLDLVCLVRPRLSEAFTTFFCCNYGTIYLGMHSLIAVSFAIDGLDTYFFDWRVNLSNSESFTILARR
ncbi:hypothetical protein F4781DRAFT_387794 [Annulohypoxylon bovei var. microspora]|nr:hypothetical protein F4781DRAFT_387794 [Annulohypoxylon bovei var. microspora]